MVPPYRRFEVFECVRKICLVGFPVFFVNSSLEQLMLGLVVVFISQSVFMWFKPYRDPADNTLQMLCQVGIFFALLSKIILDHPEVTSTQSSVLGVLLGLGERVELAAALALCSSLTCSGTARHSPLYRGSRDGGDSDRARLLPRHLLPERRRRRCVRRSRHVVDPGRAPATQTRGPRCRTQQQPLLPSQH